MKDLGDQATMGSSNYPTSSRPGAHLLVRSGNVLLRVKAQVDYEALSETSIPQHVIEEATQAAARDVLSHLDIEVSPPPMADPGPITEAKDVCPALADEVDALLPSAHRDRRTPSPRQRLCNWSAADTAAGELEVTTYAVPGDLTGRSAMQVARGAFRAGDGRRLNGLGDEAVISSSDEILASATVTVRHQNLIILVDYRRVGLSLTALEQGAERVAREVLSAYR